jgi:hypothetical protein
MPGDEAWRPGWGEGGGGRETRSSRDVEAGADDGGSSGDQTSAESSAFASLHERHLTLQQEHASLLQAHAGAVDAACTVVRSALEHGVNWLDLQRLVDAEAAGGNPIASLIVRMNLRAGRITLALRDDAAAAAAAAERGGAELTGWFAGDLARGLLGGLSWKRSDGVWLESKGFAGGGWDEGKWRLGLHLASPPAPGDEARRLRVAWDRGGTAALEIRNLDTNWLADWRTGPAGPDIAVRALELEASPGTEGFFEGGGHRGFRSEAVRAGADWCGRRHCGDRRK